MHYRPTIIDRFDFLSTRRPLPPEERGRERSRNTSIRSRSISNLCYFWFIDIGLGIDSAMSIPVSPFRVSLEYRVAFVRIAYALL